MHTFVKSVLITLSLSVLFISCKKDRTEVAFSLDFEENFEIGSGLDPFFVHTYVVHDINTLLSSRLSQNSLTLADISTINPQSALIFSVGNNIDYDYIQDISVLGKSADGSIEKEIFYRENIPFSVDTEINLLPTLVDLKALFNEGQFDIEIKLTLRDISPSSALSKIRMEFNAKR